MYIYDLPFETNKELCRLLDNQDYWKVLAGEHMKFKAFDVIEIEQKAKHSSLSPTRHLLIKWGQLNHRVEELFILLYYMKHVPALRCIAPLLDSRFHKLLKKLDSNNVIKKSSNSDVNGNMKLQDTEGERASLLPVPIQMINQGSQLQTSSNEQNRNSPNVDTTTDTSRNSSSSQSRGNDVCREIMKNVSAIPKISYEDLQIATNNWSPSNQLGRGGFGQVFKGEWKHLPVAIKRLQKNDERNQELIRELCLNQYRHDNILPLYGYSIGGKETCLVYQLMAGGTLDQRLRRKTQHPPLTWPQRYRVAHGVARGLQYLHNMAGTPLIHGDIKPANILLDQCSMPKIGDFGLARKGPYGEDRTHLKVTNVFGTRPYLPDEYRRSHRLSAAVDVFSYGVVLLEAGSALAALDRARAHDALADHAHALAHHHVDMATLEDPILKGTPNSDPDFCRMFMAIGLHCTKYYSKDRPTMLEVYKKIDAYEFPGKNLE